MFDKFTQKQKDFILYKNLKVDKTYRFWSTNSITYSEPNYISYQNVLMSIFNNLTGRRLNVIEIKDDFCKVNFVQNPVKNDFYVLKEDLSSRTFLMCLFLFTITVIPFLLYNIITKFKV